MRCGALPRLLAQVRLFSKSSMRCGAGSSHQQSHSPFSKSSMRCGARIIPHPAHINQGFWAIFGILGIGFRLEFGLVFVQYHQAEQCQQGQ